MEQVVLDLTELKAELKKWLDQRLEESLLQVENSLNSAISKSSQNPALEKRVKRLEGEVRAIDERLETMIAAWNKYVATIKQS